MSEQTEQNLSIELTETSDGWTLSIATTSVAVRRELAELDGAVAEVTVSPNLVPGVPFTAALSIASTEGRPTSRNGAS
jgi:hypothetical protein